MSNNTITTCIAHNRALKNAKLNADQIGADNFTAWKNAVNAMLKPAYVIAAARHDAIVGGYKAEVDQSVLYMAVKGVLELIGKVNGHDLDVKAIADNIIGCSYAWKVKDISPELMFERSAKKNDEALLRKYKTTAGVNPEAITALEQSIEEHKNNITALEAIPGNCIREYTVISDTTFRTSVERFLGDAINEQNAKTWEELEAEAEAKKEARRARQQAKRAAKKAAEQAAEQTAA